MHLWGKLVSLLLMASSCLLFSSCAGFNADTESLMRRPRLTAEQKSIEDALLSSVPAGDISFKYPQKGDYRSAFIFQDVDADGSQEALVFYIYGGSSYARLAVLDHNEQNEWETVCELSGPHQNVDFISFSHLRGDAAADILVGWSDPDSGEKRMEVYTYTNQNLNRLMDSSAIYDTYLVDDLDQNGVEDLFLFSRDSATNEQSSWIHLLGYDGYQLGITDELPLADSLVGFAQVKAGRISPDEKRRGLFIDEVQAGGNFVTEVFSLQAGDLVPIIDHTMVNSDLIDATSTQSLQLADNTQDEAPVELPTLYEMTVRSSSTAVCIDINNDDIIEIPTGQLLPGYEDVEENEQLFLTEYNQLQNKSFRRVASAITNPTAGYRIQFPSAWVGQVTVVNQPENNEWRFIEYDEAQANPLENLARELMRIRVVSKKDYQDRFLENYTVLATRGAFTYYGYIPENAGASLQVTAEQLKNELFSLL